MSNHQVGKSYLSKLVSLPFLGGSRQRGPAPNVYGKTGNLQHKEEHGRAFYL